MFGIKTFLDARRTWKIWQKFYAASRRDCKQRTPPSHILQHIQLSRDSVYFNAFTLPNGRDDLLPIGSDGTLINEYYLFARWAQGYDAGILKDQVATRHERIWHIPLLERHKLLQSWKDEIRQELMASMETLFGQYTHAEKELYEYFYKKQYEETLKRKRIIACTTTAAAKYFQALVLAEPSVIIVEEAGEVLESHLLTAMTSDTKKLVMIGDHKQLRPKIKNHALSVESGHGFNLNMSLFERLVLRGFPHSALSEQHRMRPEISRLVRSLAYPNISDSPKTHNRPHLKGFQSDVVFVDHNELEKELANYAEKKETTVLPTKQNLFEVEMSLIAVRYLAQQGYDFSKMVILTPYLGQLSLLRDEISKTQNPLLNNFDLADLIDAGLIRPGIAEPRDKSIRISTIGMVLLFREVISTPANLIRQLSRRGE